MALPESVPRTEDAEESDYIRVIRNLQYQLTLREYAIFKIARAAEATSEEKPPRGTESLLLAEEVEDWVKALVGIVLATPDSP